MRKIVYYVASSLDGYIAGPHGDISGFVSAGSGVEAYLADLAAYDTVIMGRKTYEFGYAYGLQPGQPAYAGMKHYLFSSTLAFSSPHPDVQVLAPSLAAIESIQQQPGTDIYLCGGGQLAGWLLDHRKIDVLKLKLNPFIQGSGTRIFGSSATQAQLQLQASRQFDHGLQILTFGVRYA
ncbi:MAG: dihydrofolate reductase family protein [Bacteroidia bacterium]|nr:dihydrofolate reductase family protein [Bacteroidia bacterium]